MKKLGWGVCLTIFVMERRKFMKKLGWGVCLTIFVMGFLLIASATHISAASKAEHNWTFAGCCKRQNATGDGLALFGDLLTKYSNGRIKLELFFNSELCTGKDCIEQLDQKAIEITHISVGNYGAFSNTLRAIEMPYIWDSLESWKSMSKGPIGEKIKEIVEKKDKRKFLGLFGGGGPRHLWTSEPMKTPSDLRAKHMKIRSTPSPIENESIKAWGGIPTPVPWGELYQALQGKLIRGHLLQKIHADLFRAYEGAPYCTEIGYRIGNENVFMNLDYFNSLPEDIQQVVLRAAREATEYSLERIDYYDKLAKERMMKKGVKFYIPTPDEMKQWKDAVLKEVWPKHRGEADQEILNLILKAQNK